MGPNTLAAGATAGSFFRAARLFAVLLLAQLFISGQAQAGAYAPFVQSNPPDIPVGATSMVDYQITLDPTSCCSGTTSGFFIDVTFGGSGTGDLTPINQMPVAFVDGSPMGNWNCTGSAGSFQCTPIISGEVVGDLPSNIHVFTVSTMVTGSVLGQVDLNMNCNGACDGMGASGNFTIVRPPTSQIGPDTPDGTTLSFDVTQLGGTVTQDLVFTDMINEGVDGSVDCNITGDPGFTFQAPPSFPAAVPSGGSLTVTIAGTESGTQSQLNANLNCFIFDARRGTRGGPPSVNYPLQLNYLGPTESRLRTSGSGPAQAPLSTTITYNFQVDNFDDPGNPNDGLDSTNIILDIFFNEIPFNFMTDAQLAGFSGSGWTCTPVMGGQRRTGGATPAGSSLGYFCDWTGTLSVGQSTSNLQVMVTLPSTGGIDFEAVAFPFGTNYNSQTGDELILLTNVTSIVDADLSLTKSADTTTPLAGGQFTYNLNVDNLGPSTAFDFTIIDDLPDGVTSVGSTGTDFTCSQLPGNSIRCDYQGSGVAPGEGTFVGLVVNAPDQAGPILNTARVVSDNDNFPSNDESSFEVQVVTEQMVDLSLVKTATSSAALQGGPLDYMLFVNNTSSFDATNVQLVDSLPLGVQFLGAQGMGWSCIDQGGTIVCDKQLIAAGASSTLTLMTLAPDAEGPITNTASVSSDLTDVDDTNNTSSVTVNVGPGTDVSITKTASSGVVVNGGPVTYDLTVTNLGPNDATGVVVTDNLPGQFSLVNFSASMGDCDVLSTDVICHIGLLAPGNSAMISLSGSITGTPDTSVVNQALVSSDTPDTDPGNNSDGVSVQIGTTGGDGLPADLALTLFESADPVLTESSLEYRVNVRNNGPAQVREFSLFNDLSTNVVIDSVSASSSGMSCTFSAHQVTCSFDGFFNPTEEIDVFIGLSTPVEPGTATISSSLGTTFLDPDPTNDDAMEETEIRVTPTEEQLQEQLTDALGDSSNPAVRNNIAPIADLCANPIDSVLALCREISEALDDGRDDEVAMAITQTIGQLTGTQHSSLIEAGAAQLANIVARLREIRGGGGGGNFSISGLNVRMGRSTLPIGLLQGAFEDEEDAAIDSQGLIKPWGFFINGTVGGGDHDPTDLEQGYDFDTLGVTAGVDYRFSLNGVVGAAIGWADFESDFVDGSLLETDGYTLSLYGSYYPSDRFYVDGRLSFGTMDFDQLRRISFTIGDLTVNDTAFGQTEADHWSGAFSVGYLINRDTWNFTPSANLSIFQADIDSFTETGTDLALSYDSQDVDSLIASASISVSKVFSLSRGVLTPQFDVSFHHEAENDDLSLNSQIVGAAASSAFFVDTDSPDSNYGSASVGLVFIGANGRQAYLTYREIFGLSGFSRWTVNLGGRFEF